MVSDFSIEPGAMRHFLRGRIKWRGRESEGIENAASLDCHLLVRALWEVMARGDDEGSDYSGLMPPFDSNGDADDP